MSKYSRHQSVISRNADDKIEEDHWLKQFHKKLEKGAVQSKSIENSFYDQINSIMNGKSKYTSVDAAVSDMKDRSGLTAYLDKLNKVSEDNESNNTTTKTAASETEEDNNSVIDKKIHFENVEPIIIKKCPKIKNTLENIIQSSSGNLSLPAIIDRLRSIHQSDISDGKDWEDQGLIIYVSRLNLKEKGKHSHDTDESHLGMRDSSSTDDIDPSNTDAFNSLNPAKI